MKKLYNSFLIAFSMYSKIPMPQCEWSEENMAYAMCFFPWVGAVIGAVTWVFGVFGDRAGLNPAFYTIILVLIPWFITGGIHLDGLLDTADAMSSYQERDRRLEILKDSHAGAFAVITCVVYYLFYYGVYSQVTLRAFPIIALSFVLSRTLSALAIVTFPKAKKTGSVSAMARGAKDRQVKITMFLYLALILAAMLALDWKLGAICFVTALIVYGLYYKKAMKHFGGTTGDLAGCFLTLCELFTACAVVLAVLIPGI
ncbi:MAG: adenosylcobinamide-GDP ribazoletransferase [Clostridiales bacterium]|nr:adenosylcobinamide-GDP ribazoletransferase [Clostridiales bacterium]